MEELDFQPEIVGREEELKELQDYLEKAAEGRGSTLFISGEAGIGKTRLVDELKNVAESKGFRILSGNSLYESLTPYMPFMDALRSGGLETLFAEEVPKVECIYLVTNTGLLIKEVLREETELDSDIFASMLTSVGNFVKDSLSMLKGEERRDKLNRLGYGAYTILIESGVNTNLVAVLSGRENEFLINNMRDILVKVQKSFGSVLRKWDGDVESVLGIEKLMQPLITSGKYDGIHYGIADPKARRNFLFENVSLGLIRQTRTKPTLLCIEDLQWADPSSLAMMHYVSRNGRDCKLMVIGTYRPEDVAVQEEGRAHHLFDTLHLMTREDLLHKIELRRLEEKETSDVLTALLGKFDFPDDFKAHLYKETEGNPLFIIEVIKLLIEEKLIVKDNGIWKLSAETKELRIPSKVYDVIVRRLGRLSAEHRKILDYGAVLGDEFDPSLLAEVMKIKKVELLEQLRDLEQIHKLIRFSDSKCTFDHTNTKEVLYTEIPTMLRNEYHSIIANCIEEMNKEDLSKVIGDLAYHYCRCGNLEKGLEYLMSAAEIAKKGYAITEGIRFNREALDLIGEEGFTEERLKILSDLGELSRTSGELDNCYSYYSQLLELCDEAGNDPKKIEAYHNIGLVHKRRNEWDETIENLENSLKVAEKINDLHSVAENYYDIGYVHFEKGNQHEAIKFFGKSLENSVNIGDGLMIALAYRAFGDVHVQESEYEKAANYFQKSLEILEKTDNLYEIAKGYCDIGVIYFLMDKIDKAIEYNEKCIEITKKTGDIWIMGYGLLNAAEAYTEKHRFEKAMEHLDKALGVFKKLNEKMLTAAVYRDYGILYKHEKDWSKSSEWFSKAVDIYENQVKAPNYQAYTYYHFGLMLKEKGNKKEAIKYLRKALEMYDKLEMIKDSEKVKKELDGL